MEVLTELVLLVLVGKEHSLLGIGCKEKAKAVSKILEAIAKPKVLEKESFTLLIESTPPVFSWESPTDCPNEVPAE